jgi:two-component system response regulator FixJ
VTPTIYVVDDDPAVRDSLQFALEAGGFTVQTFDAATAVVTAALSSCGCVLTDYRMPGMNGLQLQDHLAAQHIILPVIVMTSHAEVSMAVRAMKAGAVDFLEKPFNDEQLMDAITRALRRNREELAAAEQSAAASRQIALLTPREREVLEHLVTGKSSKEIAKILGTSPRTIDVHRAHVSQKLHTDSLPSLVRLVQLAAPR